MTILTPELAARMLDAWAIRQNMMPAQRKLIRGTLLDAALGRVEPPANRGSAIGLGQRKTKPWTTNRWI